MSVEVMPVKVNPVGVNSVEENPVGVTPIGTDSASGLSHYPNVKNKKIVEKYT